MPKSGSDPARTAVARPSPSRANTTGWPWRSMRKVERSSALAASTTSERSVSTTTIPSRVEGSNIFTVPCIISALDASHQAARAPVRATHDTCAADPHLSDATLRLGDLAGLQARRAHLHALRCAVHDRAHALNVRVPAALRAPMRVA